jgi:hypothetical protein
LFMRRICTAASHSAPYHVLWRIAFSVRGNAAASAATTSASSHRRSGNHTSFAAVAQDIPVGKRWPVTNGLVYDSPLSKSLAGQVYKSMIAAIRMCIRHAKSPTQVSWVQALRESQLLSVPLYFTKSALEGQFSANQ